MPLQYCACYSTAAALELLLASAGADLGAREDALLGFMAEREAAEREVSERDTSERDTSEEREAKERAASLLACAGREVAEREVSERDASEEREAAEREVSERDASEERDVAEREATEREVSERDENEWAPSLRGFSAAREDCEFSGVSPAAADEAAARLELEWCEPRSESSSSGSMEVATNTPFTITPLTSISEPRAVARKASRLSKPIITVSAFRVRLRPATLMVESTTDSTRPWTSTLKLLLDGKRRSMRVATICSARVSVAATL